MMAWKKNSLVTYCTYLGALGSLDCYSPLQGTVDMYVKGTIYLGAAVLDVEYVHTVQYLGLSPLCS